MIVPYKKKIKVRNKKINFTQITYIVGQTTKNFYQTIIMNFIN